jgi:hypothetical protein
MSPSTLSIWRHEFVVPPDSDLVSFNDISIPVITDVHDWQGWAWIRSQSVHFLPPMTSQYQTDDQPWSSRPTWIEAEHVQLADLDEEKGTHLSLLQSKSDPSHQIAIYPVSSSRAQGTLTGRPRRDQDPSIHSPLRLRGRRTSSDTQPGRLLLVAVSSRPGGQADPLNLVKHCVEIGRQWAHEVEGRSSYTPSLTPAPQSPLDKLSFCTWTSLGESKLLATSSSNTPSQLIIHFSLFFAINPATRPTLQNLTSLCRSLKISQIPIKSFLIDAGWQSITSDPDTGDIGGDTIRRKLVAFEAYDGLGAGLDEVVGMIKKELSEVEDVGIWMT